LFILDHNFWTRNARKVDQRLKRLGLELSFQWKLQRNTWPSGWALGQETWAKMTQKLLYLWRHSQKIRIPNQKKIFRVQTKRQANPFEPLNSSLAQLAEELWRC